MSSVKTDNYWTTQDHSVRVSWSESRIIPAHTWVKPISKEYLPKHVFDNGKWSAFDDRTDVFCYSSYGLLPLPRKILAVR